MKTTYANNRFIVIDDLLSQEDFNFLWIFLQSTNFSFVHSKQWVNAFRLSDGSPLWSTPYVSHNRSSDPQAHTYPTGFAIDIFIKTVLSLQDLLDPYIGSHPKDWDFFFCRPYLYPVGSGLSWHMDGKYKITGAYAFYCHPQWSANWGAELLIDRVCRPHFETPVKKGYLGEEIQTGFHLDSSLVNQAVAEQGIGDYILPLPNRLVVFKPGLLHTIKPVDSSAGDHVRSTLTGFFMNENLIKAVKES
jgi:hypothetical protein